MDFIKRRSFIKGFGLGGVIVGSAASGFAAAKALSNVTSQPAPAVVVPQLEDISHLAPVDNPMAGNLVLMRNNDEPEPPPPGVLVMPSNIKSTHEVAMSVGKDNRLWLKVEDKWMRVVVQEDLA